MLFLSGSLTSSLLQNAKHFRILCNAKLSHQLFSYKQTQNRKMKRKLITSENVPSNIQSYSLHDELCLSDEESQKGSAKKIIFCLN